MLSLTIHHNIHLTKHERYSLHEGKDVEVVGVSVPVWFMGKTTSEPAKEVFCKYYLRNPDKDIPVQILENGYEIAIPHRKGTPLDLTDEEWRYFMSHDPDTLDDIYRRSLTDITSKLLLDVNDGGSGFLFYREHNKIEKEKYKLNVIHFVSIKSIESTFN